MDHQITVVYAMDEGYLKYSLISIYSMLKNLKINVFCKIFILVPENFNEDLEKTIKKVLCRFDNYELKLIRIGDFFNNIDLKIGHITTPTYYRLLLPELLPDEDKCVYLDGDTIVNGDISQLYDYEIGNNYIGGVRAFAYYRNELNTRARLGYDNNEKFEYVNAGVLLFNLKIMRESNLQDKFLSKLSNKYAAQDQDIINVTCKGRIFILPMFFNTMTKYATGKYSSINKWAQEDEYQKASSSPIIIHYADNIKPWNDYTIPWASKWWQTCLTPDCWQMFYDDKIELLIKAMDSKEAAPKKKNTNLILYLKLHGIKYAFRRIISALK